MDHVAALLTRHFPDSERELRVGGVSVQEIAAEFGTPLFAYDASVLDRKWTELRETLREFCAANMPRHMIPKAIEVLDQMPRTTSGKVDYPALRRREGL